MEGVSNLDVLSKIWAAFSAKNKVFFFLLLVLSLLVSALEVLTISSLIPFLMAFSDPITFFEKYKFLDQLNFLDGFSKESIQLFMAVIFIIVILLSGAIKVFHVWTATFFSELNAGKLVGNLFKSVSMDEYPVHRARNSSEVISAFIQKSDRIALIIFNVLLLIVNLFISLSIAALLLYLYPTLAFSLGLFVGVFYGSVLFFVRGILTKKGSLMAKLLGSTQKTLKEFLSSIKETIIYSGQQKIFNIYNSQTLDLRRATASAKAISQSPKFIIESLGISLIVLYVLLSFKQGVEFNELLPFLAVLAFSAQRLLPSIQQIFGSYATIKGSSAAALDIFSLIDNENIRSFNSSLETIKEEMKNKNIKSTKIETKDLNYFYGNHKILRDISFTINEGENVALLGGTGSGKSTLMDCLMGLNLDYSGEILISDHRLTYNNHKQWMRNIAHVPQSIFLFDATFVENITLFEKYDDCLFQNCIQAACLQSLFSNIQSRPEQKLGEDGSSLSGGQRQRIAIARALYRNPKLLFMDEGTSALDEQTEKEVFLNIRKLFPKIQLVCITHRPKSIENFELKITLSNGNAKLIRSNNDFSK